MISDNPHYNSLISLLLPSEIFDYFTISNVDHTEKEVHVHLEEINSSPSEYNSFKLTSKGFHSTSIVQDFPIRDKSMFLHIRRRRWLVEDTGKVVSRDWSLVARGTRLTAGFASFLKGIIGYIPNK